MIDEDIIKHIKEGSKEEREKAFAILYDKYKNFVYDFGRTMGLSRDLCFDFIQVVFFRLFEKINKFKEGKEFFPWFFSLVRNECINFIKRNKKFINNSDNDISTSVENLNLDEFSIVNEIRDFLNTLPYEEREVIFLKYYQGFDCKEIAKIIGVSERKTYILIERAVEKIRKHLGIS